MKGKLFAAIAITIIVCCASICIMKYEYRKSIVMVTPLFPLPTSISIQIPHNWSNISKHKEIPTIMYAYIDSGVVILEFARPEPPEGVRGRYEDDNDDYYHTMHIINP